jgi:hypothetical protein
MTPNPDSDDHLVEPPPWSISIRASRRLFWSHAVLIASKGSTSRIGSLSAEWELFFEWELLRQGEEALLGVKEMTDNPVVSSGEASGKSGSVGGASQFYAPTASIWRHGGGDLSACSAVRQ